MEAVRRRRVAVRRTTEGRTGHDRRAMGPGAADHPSVAGLLAVAGRRAGRPTADHHRARPPSGRPPSGRPYPGCHSSPRRGSDGLASRGRRLSCGPVSRCPPSRAPPRDGPPPCGRPPARSGRGPRGLPGRSPSGGRSATTDLHEATPTLAVARVLHGDPAGHQLVTEPVRCCPVASRPGGDTLVEQRRRLGRERVAGSSGRTPSTWSRSRSVTSARSASALDSVRASMRRLRSRTSSNTAANAVGHVEVVVERRSEGASTGRQHVRQGRVVGSVLAIRVEGGDERIEAVDGRSGGRQRLVGIVQAHAVVHRDERRNAARAARSRSSRSSSTRAMLPVDLAIFVAARSGGGRSAARSRRTAARWPPRSGRSRPRGAGR